MCHNCTNGCSKTMSQFTAWSIILLHCGIMRQNFTRLHHMFINSKSKAVFDVRRAYKSSVDLFIDAVYWGRRESEIALQQHHFTQPAVHGVMSWAVAAACTKWLLSQAVSRLEPRKTAADYSPRGHPSNRDARVYIYMQCTHTHDLWRTQAEVN